MNIKNHLPDQSDVKKIVCFMFGEIGDLIVTSATWKALKKKYPDASLTLIIRENLSELCRESPYVDEVFPYSNSSKLKQLIFLLKLRNRKWDLWVDLHTPTFNTMGDNQYIFKRNLRIMKIARVRYRLGFAVPIMLNHLTHAVAVPDYHTLVNENIVDTTLRLAGGSEHRGKEIVLSAEVLKWADDFIFENKLTSTSFIGLFFGAKQSANVWPIENIIEFCRKACHKYKDHRFILFGGPSEMETANQLNLNLKEQMAYQIINLIGKTSLVQSSALINRSKLMITTASGPMHIADAFDVPMIVLFTSQNYPLVWKPLSDSTIVLNVPVECGPCLVPDCFNNHLCMNSIRPDHVIKEMENVFSQS